MAQQVLMQVTRGLAGFRGEGTLSAWCDRITVRTAIAHARKSRAEAVQSLSDEAGGDVEVEGPDDDYVARREAVELLDVLPVEQRSAVVMHHLLGFSVPEIAEQETISAETVRSRLRLGMARLRQNAGEGQQAS